LDENQSAAAAAAAILPLLPHHSPAAATPILPLLQSSSIGRMGVAAAGERQSSGAAGLGLWVWVVGGGSLCVRTFLVWGTVSAIPDTKILCRGQKNVGSNMHSEQNLVTF